MQERPDLKKYPVVEELIKKYKKHVKNELINDIGLLIGSLVFIVIFTPIYYIYSIIKGEMDFSIDGLLVCFISLLYLVPGFVLLALPCWFVYWYRCHVRLKVTVGTVSKATYSYINDDGEDAESYVVIVDNKKYRLGNHSGLFNSISDGETYVFLLTGRTIRACINIIELNE